MARVKHRPSREAAFSLLSRGARRTIATGLAVGLVAGLVACPSKKRTPPEELPPDPVLIAPPVDRTRATCLSEAIAFLWTAETPVQRAVTPGTFTCRRAALLRGVVTTRDGEVLSGVRVTVKDHPEQGYTLSRLDGRYDLAVLGGGVVTVQYAKSGFLPAHRQRRVRPQQTFEGEDVSLIPLDEQQTRVSLGAGGGVRVARSTPVSDADGTRQGTLLVPPDTRATADASGTPSSRDSLSLRITEYTVGSRGRTAMPGGLPPTSAYTYAMELTGDDATADATTHLHFDRPLYYYVENFLGFPAGTPVPAGYYDRARALWVPSDSGVVVDILAVTDGQAALDVDGDGAADSGATLTELGITDGERSRLGELYEAGQSLWRVPIRNFSPWDCNWPFGLPWDAREPGLAEPTKPGDQQPCQQKGSIIGCQDQSLGQAVGVAGTSFGLHYVSSRVPGSRAAFGLTIPLTGAELPASLKRVDLQVEVAGRHLALEFPPDPNRSHLFQWDGRDVYGRLLQGQQSITTRVGYVYDGVYEATDRFGQTGAGAEITGDMMREEMTVWQTWEGTLGSWDMVPLGFGGWTLSIHHVYDPRAKMLHRGDGRRRSAASAGVVMSVLAGDGDCCAEDEQDGGPAIAAHTPNPRGIALGPDGSVYYTAYTQHAIRRVDPDGIMHRVAGRYGAMGYDGDGGPALEATLRSPDSLAFGPDGTLFFIDDNRIRKIDRRGIIHTAAGNGESYVGLGDPAVGDGGPALEAELMQPMALAVGPDGSLYVSGNFGHLVRRISPDGLIQSFVGRSVSGSDGDGGPATEATIHSPTALAVGPDGSLYLSSAADGLIRRVRLDGIIETVAGGGTEDPEDGLLATQVSISPQSLALGTDGALYLTSDNRVHRIDPQGVITTIAGAGQAGCEGYDGPASAALLNGYAGDDELALGPDGVLYVASWACDRLLKIKLPFPGFEEGEIYLAAETGQQVYVFDHTGRHLRTLDGLTGTPVWTFDYDDEGRLAAVSGGDGEQTLVERDSDGQPAALVAPGGQRTALTLDAAGYLSGVAHPGGATVAMTYDGSGLMLSYSDGDGARDYGYDDMGRLLTALPPGAQPGDASAALTRTVDATGLRVEYTSPGGRVTTYRVDRLASGDLRQRTVMPWGGATDAVTRTDGSRELIRPDGTVFRWSVGSDPRFGMQAPRVEQMEILSPGGELVSFSSQREVVLASEADPFSVTTWTETLNVNGQAYTRTYDAVSGEILRVSPEGRESRLTVDAQGRLASIQADATLEPATYTYDAQGRLSEINHGDQRWTYTYDAQGRAATRTDAAGRVVETTFDDTEGLVGMRLPSGRLTELEYDALGRLTRVGLPGGGDHWLSYTPDGKQAQYTDPGGESWTMFYGLDGERDRTVLPSGRTVQWSFDGGGRLAGLSYPGATVAVTYSDETLRPDTFTWTATAGGAPQTTAFAYDGQRLTETRWTGPAAAAFGYRWEQAHLAGITLEGEAELTLTRDSDGYVTAFGPFAMTRSGPAGVLSSLVDGALTVSYEYDVLGRPSRRTHVVAGVTVYDLQLSYTNAGHLEQRTERVGPVTEVHTFDRDPDGQLTVLRRDGVATESYGYDDDGNRTGRQVGAVNETASYNGRGLLTDLGATPYVFDVDGYLTQRGADTFTYSARGELLEATVGAQTITYTYDGFGRRLARTGGSGTTAYLHGNPNDPFQVTAVLPAGGTLADRILLFYDDQNHLYAMEQGAAVWYVATDPVGSPRVVADSAGVLLKEVTYDSFGVVLSDSDPAVVLPLGFAGGVLDPDTGLVRFGLRDYDPRSGRWTAPDPIRFHGGQANLYAYVNNAPLDLRDPSGLVCLGGSWFYGFGGGARLCVDPRRGFSACVEGGVGLGSSVDIDLLGGLDQERTYGRVEASASFLGLAGANLGLEVSDSRCGPQGSLSGGFSAGPVSRGGSFDLMSGRFTPALGYSLHSKGYEVPRRWLGRAGGGKPSLKPGVSAQIKAVVGRCWAW